MEGQSVLTNFSVLILAAGKSVRMQEPKFLLTLPSGRTFLEEIVFSYKSLGAKSILVVLNSEGVSEFNQKVPQLREHITVVENCNPDYGRFYSLKLGLAQCNCKHSVFMHNIDNPFVSEHVVSKLINSKYSYDYVFPQHGNRGGHPLLIDSSLCQLIVGEKNTDKSLRSYLEGFNFKGVQVDTPVIHTNINTKDDYCKFLEGLSANR